MNEFNMENKNDEFNATTAEALNKKALKITRIIKAKFPELSAFLDEMPETSLHEKQPEVSFRDLNEYYKSLEVVLNKYKLEHPDR